MKTQNLQQKKSYVLDSETSGAYAENEPIKFLTRSIESSLYQVNQVIILMRIFWSQEILLLEAIIQKRHLKISRHLENVEQK